jgi:hypothetical protein
MGYRYMAATTTPVAFAHSYLATYGENLISRKRSKKSLVIQSARLEMNWNKNCPFPDLKSEVSRLQSQVPIPKPQVPSPKLEEA